MDFAAEYRQLGLEIGYHRRQRGMSQQELAEAVGISANFLAQIEAPAVAAAPSLDTLFRIARTLEVPISTLLRNGKEK